MTEEVLETSGVGRWLTSQLSYCPGAPGAWANSSNTCHQETLGQAAGTVFFKFPASLTLISFLTFVSQTFLLDPH